MAASVADLLCLCGKKGAVRGVRMPGYFRHFLHSFLPIGKCSRLTSEQLYRCDHIDRLLKTSAQQFLDYRRLSLVPL